MSETAIKRIPLRVVTVSAVLLGAFAALTAAAASIVERKVEEPSYETKLRDGRFEVRRYGPRVVAETVVRGEWGAAGNEGFRRLAAYIFGHNIAMTAPVAERPAGDAWTVAFMMPPGESLESLPTPTDAHIVLRELPEAEVAVVRFNGLWTDANIKRHTDALRAWAAARGLSVRGEPEVNRYDPPFKPWFLRRNEVWLEVAS